MRAVHARVVVAEQIRFIRFLCPGFPRLLPSRMKHSLLQSPAKSPNDKLDYRVIKLTNGLKALLISDPSPNDNDEDETSRASDRRESEASASNDGSEGDSESEEDEDETENEEEEENMIDDNEEAEEISDEGKKMPNKPGEKMAAAGLCIGVGSFSDPEDLPGLAHFLEHMVFMGSKKYPDENSFDAFIKKHGGNDNASTDCERTVFQFEIERKYFHEALDRFAQFFVSPLLKKDSIDREIESVDSEFRLSIPSDLYRKQQLISCMAKPQHPMGKFMWGNISSLKEEPSKKNIDIYSRLREFWERHYSAHYMTLAVQSREHLDTLEAWVTEIFSEIPNNNLARPDFCSMHDPFGSTFHKLYKVIPVKNCLRLELQWSLPCLLQQYRVKPLQYISWLIGHEGKGGILSYLKKRIWALSCYSGNDESGFEHNSTYASFSIQVGLTEEGFSHVFEVITVIMQYIQMLQKIGPQERIYKEIQTVDDNAFRWQEEANAVEYVENLSENMQLYPEADIITGSELMYEFDSEGIKKCQDLLTPDKCCIILTSRSFEKENICDKTEPWYQTHYSESDIPQEWLDKWNNLESNPELHVPEVNKFIATDFDIKASDMESSNYPVKILEDEQSRLWYRKDEKFNVPKAYAYFRLSSPVVNYSPQSTVLMDLFVSSLGQNLKEEVYPASVAQLSYSIFGDEKGLLIYVHGFNHRLPALFETILDYIKNFNIENNMFSALKNFLRKGYYNCFIKPSQLCKDVRLSILQQVHWTPVDQRAAVNFVTREMLISFVKEFTSCLFIEGLVQGNVTSKEAVQLDSLIRTKLNCSIVPASILPEVRILQLPEGERYCLVSSFNKHDGNSVVTNYYQSGPANIKKSCLMDLLMMLMEEPCFDVLRTREQLGYHVYCLCRCTFGILGFSVTVHTHADKFSTPFIDGRIEAFLKSFKEQLSNFSEKDFQTQVSSLIKLKECVDLHLKEEMDRNWSEILSANYVFERLNLEIACLKEITLAEVQDWYAQHISSGTKTNFRKLGVHIVGQVKLSDAIVKDDENKLPQKTCLLCVEDSNTKKGRRDSDKSSAKRSKSECKHVTAALDDDKVVYALDILPEAQGLNSELMITEIQDFKQGLMIYPVSKIIS